MSESYSHLKRNDFFCYEDQSRVNRDLHDSLPPWAIKLEHASSFRLIVALCLLSIPLFFLPLAQSDLYNKGEPREGLVVQDMVHSGRWLLPLRNNELPSKPPMFHWIASAVSLLAGTVNAFTVRFPSALLGLAGVILTYLFGKKIKGQAVGFVAALVLGTCFRYAKLSTQARVDITTAFFVMSTIVLFYFSREKERDNSFTWVGFYVLLASAVLAKGPLGVALPLLAIGIYGLLQRDVSFVKKLLDWKGIVVFLLLAGGWYATALIGWGEGFFEKQILTENLAAAMGETGHVHGPFYYIPQLLVGMLPWGIFLPFMLVSWVRQKKRFRSEGDLYLLSWFLAVFGFFSIWPQKRGDYLLPLFPVVALWLGEFLWSKAVMERNPRLTNGIVFAVVPSAILGGLIFIVLPGKAAFDSLMQAFIAGVSPKDRTALMGINDFIAERPFVFSMTIGFTFVPWALSLFAWSRKGPATALLNFLVGTFFFHMLAFPIGNRLVGEIRSLRPFATEVRRFVHPEDRLFSYQAWDFSLVFYLERPVPKLPRDLQTVPDDGRRAFVILPVSEWDESPAQVKDHFVELARSRGVGSEGNQPLVLIQANKRP